MLGVLINAVAIILGGFIGIFLKKGLNEKIKITIMQGIGLSVLVIGITGAIETKNLSLLVMSLILGGMIGSILKLEDRLEKFGENIEKKFSAESGFAKGFVMASLIYCVGAMAILGSLEAGINGDITTLVIKSILDGVTAIVFTATLGYGVIFSSIPVFIYQGLIVLLGIQIEPLLTTEIITEISAVGSVLIIGIGINILEIKKIRLADLLPSLLIPILWFVIINFIG